MKTVDNIVACIKAVLAEYPDVLCCYLYGSAASGRERPDSDVDLAVACAQPMSAELKAQLFSDLAIALQRDVDLIDLLAVNGPVLRSALHGECLFCRDSALKYKLLHRLVYDQEDLQPLRRKMMERRREAFVHGS